jgi:cytidyltransferase-like protein
MIVSTADLPSLARRVAMVDGGFDPIHAGHVAYFRAAAELGAPVLCNVSDDAYVSTKHTPVIPESERIRVIDAIRFVDYVHLSHTATAAVLEQLVPRWYVKGRDWRGRLPEEEVALCEAKDIEIRFLDTVTNSSTELFESLVARIAETERR